MGLLSMITGAASEADATRMEAELKDVLIEGESVERAFVFVRDQLILTNLRVIFVNKQGITGSKTSWQTIPYSRITSFSAETAGMMDMDAELTIWVTGLGLPLQIKLGKGVPIKEVYQSLSRLVLKR